MSRRKVKTLGWLVGALACVLGALACMLGALACSSGGSPPSVPVADPEKLLEKTMAPNPGAPVMISPRSQILAGYPCSDCHETLSLGEPQVPPRGPHHSLRFAHMESVGDCRQCHDYQNLDQLRLITGELVSFDDTERLCGQCHGRQRRDWHLGIHGKQVGSWRGLKHRYSCPQCHDPHRPGRVAVDPYPPPPRPALGIRKEAH